MGYESRTEEPIVVTPAKELPVKEFNKEEIEKIAQDVSASNSIKQTLVAVGTTAWSDSQTLRIQTATKLDLKAFKRAKALIITYANCFLIVPLGQRDAEGKTLSRIAGNLVYDLVGNARLCQVGVATSLFLNEDLEETFDISVETNSSCDSNIFNAYTVYMFAIEY